MVLSIKIALSLSLSEIGTATQGPPTNAPMPYGDPWIEACRYATVLADDPGSSVLTLTSLGMTQLGRPVTGGARSRVIALWKDYLSGSPPEISLDEGSEAVLLSLSLQTTKEYSADGRSKGETAICPVLTGIRSVRRSGGVT
jgi:hypothetical protein